MLKRFMRSRAAGAAASGAIAFYIRLVEATSSSRFIGREHADALLNSDKGFILAFWHSRLLMAASLRGETDRTVKMLISTHRDGEIIARAVKGFGIEMIRGSAADPKKPEKNKSGAPAILAMMEALETGAIVGMTPDGPRGPAETAKIGAIKLAARTGAPILAGAYSASRGRRLQTWDRFLLAAPFSRLTFAARPAIHVERNADADGLEAYRRRLESELKEAARIADEAAGRSN
ncbi:MAG: lysophospholipid acyltransferase family protein [Parvularculaceae bacterium]|nr:lysophospholipid acyltransferase family protein [Parvularculaceae bacterium]